MYKLTNTIEPHFEILRNGGTYGVLEAYGAPEIQCAVSSALKMSFKGSFRKPELDVNWLADRIQAGIKINGEDYRMGVYIPVTVTTQHTEQGDILDVEAYSILYLAQRKKFEERWFIAAGTGYIDAVQMMLREAGIEDYYSDRTPLVLPFDREFEEGTTILDAVNALLVEINYNTAWVNMAGQVQMTKYEQPSAENIKHTYEEGEYSVLYDEYTVSSDQFGKANVFRLVCSHPELNEPMIAEAENADINSPFSTKSLGVRILDIETVESVPDLDTLENMAFKKMIESKQTMQVIEFSTAIVPTHETFDIVALQHGEMSGIYREIEWRAALDASGNMAHKAERVVAV